MTVLFIAKRYSYLVILFSVAIFAACETPRVAQDVPTQQPAASPVQTAQPGPSPAATAKAPEQAITLPIIDALFADDAFVSAAKNRAGLSDEQIEQLKNRARNDVLEMNEEDTGSTKAAVSKAQKEVRDVLGSERAQKFMLFVQEQLASENKDLDTSRPNVIPSDTRIVVNAPEYRMDVFKDGKLLKTYKIGIGYPEFPLPTGLRKASTMIFNPTWTPPDEPWVKGKFKAGKKVEAGSKDNPLGIAKIPIGLPNLIHGGKAAGRLGKFASHGCVGLTDQLLHDFVLDLASISGTELTDADIKDIQKDRDKTAEVKLADPVPVELRYETIVVEDGKLLIFRDVYEHGTNTEEDLRKVLDSYGVSLDSLPDNDRQKILAGLDQMARDAQGDRVSDPSDNANTNSNSNSAHVTKNAKGPTEFSFPIAALSGKGYPAPVNDSQGKTKSRGRV